MYTVVAFFEVMFFLTLALIRGYARGVVSSKKWGMPLGPLSRRHTPRALFPPPPPYFKILCDTLLIDALMQNEEVLCYISCVVLDTKKSGLSMQ